MVRDLARSKQHVQRHYDRSSLHDPVINDREERDIRTNQCDLVIKAYTDRIKGVRYAIRQSIEFAVAEANVIPDDRLLFGSLSRMMANDRCQV